MKCNGEINTFRPEVRMSGYLEKKNKLPFVPSWRRYWFVLDGKLLLYYRSKEDYLSLSPCRGSINLGLVSGVQPARSTPAGHPIHVVTRTQVIYLRARDKFVHEEWLHALLEAMATPQIISSPIRIGAGTQYFRYSMGAIPGSVQMEEDVLRNRLMARLSNNRPSYHRSLDSLAMSPAAVPNGHLPSRQHQRRSHYRGSVDSLFSNPLSNTNKMRHRSSTSDLYAENRSRQYAMRKSLSSQEPVFRAAASVSSSSLQRLPTCHEAVDATSTPSTMRRGSLKRTRNATCIPSKSSESLHLYEECTYPGRPFNVEGLPAIDASSTENSSSAASQVPSSPTVTNGDQESSKEGSMYEAVKFGNNTEQETQTVDVADDGDYEECLYSPPVTSSKKRLGIIRFPSLKRSQSKLHKEEMKAAKLAEKKSKKESRGGGICTDCSSRKKRSGFFYKLFHLNSKKDANKNVAPEKCDMATQSSDVENDGDDDYMYYEPIAVPVPVTVDQGTSTAVVADVDEKCIQVDEDTMTEEVEVKKKPMAGSVFLFQKDLMKELKVKMDEKRRSMTIVDEPEVPVLPTVPITVPLYAQVNKLAKPNPLPPPSVSESSASVMSDDVNDECDYSRYFPLAFQTPDHTPPLPPKTRARPLSPSHDVPLNNSPVVDGPNYNRLLQEATYSNLIETDVVVHAELTPTDLQDDSLSSDSDMDDSESSSEEEEEEKQELLIDLTSSNDVEEKTAEETAPKPHFILTEHKVVRSSSCRDNRKSDPDYDYPRPHSFPQMQQEQQPFHDTFTVVLPDSGNESLSDQCCMEVEATQVPPEEEEEEVVMVEEEEEVEEPVVQLRQRPKDDTSPLRVSYVATETLVLETEEATPFDVDDILQVPPTDDDDNDELTPLYSIPFVTIPDEEDTDRYRTSSTSASTAHKRPSQIPSPDVLRSSGIADLQKFLQEMEQTETEQDRLGAVNKLGHSVAVSKLREFFEKEGGN